MCEKRNTRKTKRTKEIRVKKGHTRMKTDTDKAKKQLKRKIFKKIEKHEK
jgi:hypothetical protein